MKVLLKPQILEINPANKTHCELVGSGIDHCRHVDCFGETHWVCKLFITKKGRWTVLKKDRTENKNPLRCKACRGAEVVTSIRKQKN